MTQTIEQKRIAHREAKRRYRAKHPEKHRAYMRQWHAAHPNKHKEYKNRQKERRYAPTRPCPVGCEICGCYYATKSLALDHNHKTEKFRGWLCQTCNMGLGHFEDDPILLLKAIQYLRKNS